MNTPNQTDINTTSAIINTVAGLYKLKASDVQMRRARDTVLSTARDIAMHLVHKHTDYDLGTVGLIFGARSHTTASKCCLRVREGRRGEVVAGKVAQVEGMLGLA